jgi:hypothetical protein
MSSSFRETQKRQFIEALRRRLGALIGHPVVNDTDVGFLCPLPLSLLLSS